MSGRTRAARTRIEDADVAAADALDHRDHPAVRTLGALSEIADQVPSFLACGSVLAYGLATGRPRMAEAGGRMLASVLVATALKSAVKALVSRTRPHAVLDGEDYEFEVRGQDGPDHHSFPSGHTAGAVAAARGLARVYPDAATPAYAVAAAIALVQIPRAKHYPADLIAGALVGVVSEWVIAGVLRSKSGREPGAREDRRFSYDQPHARRRNAHTSAASSVPRG